MNGPKSMTGFGRAEGVWRGGKLTIEARSINHRYFELKMRLPRELASMEHIASEWARSRTARGRVDVTVSIESITQSITSIKLNTSLAKQYIDICRELAREIGSSREIDPALILSMRDVILTVEENIDLDAEWKSIQPIFEKAFDAVDASGRIEGGKLAKDLKERLANISRLTEKIISAQPVEIVAYRNRLSARIAQLSEKPEIDPDRLAQELAYYAERCDFTEETVRLRSHIARFGEVLDAPGPMGRSLDFLSQEMLREINTTASKALNAQISQTAVEIKAELEKIREQVQNIE